MPIREVCSPNSSGVKPKPTPLPHPDPASRGVKHTSPWGPLIDRRNDQVTQLPEQSPIAPSASGRA
jgi:hypothetical protein